LVQESGIWPVAAIVVCQEQPENPSADADFRFVTGGIEEAYRQATEAAGDKNIYVFGGPSIVQQFLEKNDAYSLNTLMQRSFRKV
jgi:dihydrofolate reductase